jgi:hypothetical protein
LICSKYRKQRRRGSVWASLPMKQSAGHDEAIPPD